MNIDRDLKLITRPRRAQSDIEGLYSNSLPNKMQFSPEKQSNHPKIPIKINKNKLPADFFPKTEEKRRRNINKLFFK